MNDSGSSQAETRRDTPNWASPTWVSVEIERSREAFSNLPLFLVRGFWQSLSGSIPPSHIEVRYDGQTASECRPVLSRASVAEGETRFDFGTKLPVESSRESISVYLIWRDREEELLESKVSLIGESPPLLPRGRLTRMIDWLGSGVAFSIPGWLARLSRYSEKALALRMKIQAKLLERRYRPRSMHDAYVSNTVITSRLRAAIAERVQKFRYRPTISLIVPVYVVAQKRIGSRWLRKMVDSVRAQIYPNWELCLADDASTDKELLRYLDSLRTDPRIKLVKRSSNGHICAASNSAAELASGDFIALLDHDDELAPHALFAVVEHLQEYPETDLIYSDEDKIDAFGHRFDPQFKPDWSPELLLSYNYINHFTVIRRQLFEKVGRFRQGFEGSQDHDLLLRITEETQRIHHVPQILYHWRSLPDSTASSAGVKSYVHTSGQKAVGEALARRGLHRTLNVPAFAQKLNLPILALDGTDDGPDVAIIVRGKADDVRRTVESLRERTLYKHWSVYTMIGEKEQAEAYNRAAAGREEKLLLFLAAGTEIIEPRWLSRLIAYLEISGVGAASARFVDQNRSISDAGLVTGLRDGTGPHLAFNGLPANAISYYFYAESTRNSSVPSGNCLITFRSLFERLGGFDSRRYPHSLWDVDFGMRLRGQGLRCVTVADAELQLSRSRFDPPSELLALRRAYGRLRDPFHNPNCSEYVAWQPVCDAPLTLPFEAKSPPASVLVVAHNLNNPEGAPRYLSEIVIGLRNRHAINPIVFSPLGGAGAEVYSSTGIPINVCESLESQRFVDGLWSPREYARALQLAYRLFRRHRPEVVIANTLTTFPFVEAAARAGIPAVWIIHESYSKYHLDQIFPVFARKRIEQAMALAARVVPASHDTAALFTHWNTRQNFRVIHNGLDHEELNSFMKRISKAHAVERIQGDPNKVNFIAVGTICERKGQHAIVEAAAQLSQMRKDFRCYLVGAREGIPYLDYVRNLIRRYQLESIVQLVPETDDAWSYYRAADGFICTSFMETFSRAILEAEAFGLPIISTPACGISEQVVWGANAERFEFGDSSGLAGHLRDLLKSPEKRVEMGKQSRAAFENHLNVEEMLDRYEEVILAAARQGPRSQIPYSSISETLNTRVRRAG